MTFNDTEELRRLLDDPRTGLRDSSDTNKTRSAILALFDEQKARAIKIAQSAHDGVANPEVRAGVAIAVKKLRLEL